MSLGNTRLKCNNNTTQQRDVEENWTCGYVNAAGTKKKHCLWPDEGKFIKWYHQQPLKLHVNLNSCRNCNIGLCNEKRYLDDRDFYCML